MHLRRLCSLTLLAAAVAGASETSYLVPVADAPVTFKPILTVGESGAAGNPMVGIPDGLGAYDNGDGTFTVLMNQELRATNGVARAHGSVGAFVSKWVISTNTLAVQSITDLTASNTSVKLWSGTTVSPAWTGGTTAFSRFCSADLAPVTAYYNAATGLGTQNRIFLNGEEDTSTTGKARAFAHIATGPDAGTSWELPHLGKAGWENWVACPKAQNATVVVGMDDSDPGQVYVYVGTKNSTGANDIEKAGLSGGALYGIIANGLAAENRDTNVGIAAKGQSVPFTLANLGDVSTHTAASDLQTASTTAGVTEFRRPEDGAWDPNHPSDFYFVTTDRYDGVKNNDPGTSQYGRSRLWRLRFSDISNPAAGGTIAMLIDGTENPGPNMMDNIGIDTRGRILISEDIGNNNASGKLWLYDIASGALTAVAKHDPARFGDIIDGVVKAPTAPFSRDEETSGMIDVSDILGEGWFLAAVQAHYTSKVDATDGHVGTGNDATLVEGGQLVAMHIPSNTGFDATTARTAYLIPTLTGAKAVPLLTVGDSVNLKSDGVTPYRMVGLPDGLGAFDNGNGTFTLTMSHEARGNQGVTRAHGAVGSFVSRWIIDSATLRVRSGADLMTTLNLWNGTTASPAWSASASAISRQCSADMAAPSAFYNRTSGKGTTARLHLAGEEDLPSASADVGRAFAHVASGANVGTSYELPHLGRQAWENLVACPVEQDTTLVIGLDDTTSPATGGDGHTYNGQVYVYVGSKKSSGTEVEKAGLVGGALYGISVPGFTAESRETAFGAAKGSAIPFALASLGDVAGLSHHTLETLANTAGVTTFLRPEDGAWDPNHPADFYFVTTDRIDNVKNGGASSGTQVGRSRLWRLRFADLTQPMLGGTITMLIDGSENPGPNMMDNLTVDRFGRVLIQEDIGNNEFSGKIWMYDIASGALSEVFRHDPARFGDRVDGVTTLPTAPFSKDEESSGIIDASDILGPGWYLTSVQAHQATAPYNTTELIEGGQLDALYVPVPATAANVVPANVNSTTATIDPAALLGTNAKAWTTIGAASGAGLSLINGTLTGTVTDGTLSLTTVNGVKVWQGLPSSVFRTVGNSTTVEVKASGHGSAMALVPGTSNEFWLMTDRGPNLDYTPASGSGKVFPVPAFAPNLLRVRLNDDGTVTPLANLVLRRANGTTRLTGLPSTTAGSTSEVAYGLNDDNTVNTADQGTDDQGLDSEGLVAAADGTFWMSDEYGPWLTHISASGATLDRIGPFDPTVHTTFGNTSGYQLPQVLAKRTVNRGMEGLTATPGGKLVGIMQSGLDKNFNTGGVSISGKKTPVLRIVRFNPDDGTSQQYVYLLDERPSLTANFPNAVSEIVAESDTSFLVLERDGAFPTTSTIKRIYRIDLTGATDISDSGNSATGLLIGGKTIEEIAGKEQTVATSTANLLAAGVTPVSKTLVFDLLTVGGAYSHDKCEGLALVGNKLYVVNDDDFGIVSPAEDGIASAKTISGTSTTDYTQVMGIDLGNVTTSTTTVNVKVATDGTVLFRDPAITSVSADTAPTIAAIAAQAVTVNTASSAIAVTIGDAETAAVNLAVSVASSDTAVIPVSGLVLGGSGTARTLTITADTVGSATVTVTVSDGANTTSRSFTVTAVAATGATSDDSDDNSCGVGSGIAFGGLLGLLMALRLRLRRR